ncbi:MAG: isoleucine--tRNA ligase [Malacoplasma sp.]|nr:isoleucine--tRNA ligase [Malacoplasma sp.]
MSDYKKTLLMPNTPFEMKANLATKEPKIEEKWALEQIEKKVIAKNKGNKPFIIADGPIYSNGDIHVGHALNRILKDFVLRSKSQNGFYTKFIPGWDTHGLPIEQAMYNKGLNRKENQSAVEKRSNCKKFAIENVYIQKEQFIRLGMMSAMDEIYMTCELDYVIRQLKIFNSILLKGLIYQDLKPVYWSWSSQTALADAEIIYQDVESDSIFVALEIVTKNDFVKTKDQIIIWTTTPYTLPANLAVAANPKVEYCRVKVNNNFYIVGKNLVEKLAQILGWENYQIESEFLGKELENLVYISPITNKKAKVIIDSYVSDNDGTGLVHNAPGFGHEDYLACKKYYIKPYCPIDAKGHFTKDVNDKELENKFYLDANPIIIERLQKKGILLKHSKIVHSAAHDWRTKKPVIYRATKQWFVNIKKISKDIVSALSKVKSIDSSIVKKIKEMVLSRQEWCISRQRIWGVPICVIYDKDNNPILDPKLLNHIVDVLKNEGINAWYKEDAKYFLPEGYNTSKKYIKEMDIMDVWFDSGTSYSVLQADNKKTFPADLYLEGKDQFRGWFNSSLITSVAAFKVSPYKELLTHGFTLDEKGQKMSKSLGNVIDPLDVCKEYGADVLRLWVASVDYLKDIIISKQILDQNAELYRRIRNTLFRFMLGNLNGFDAKKMRGIKYSDADLYVLNVLANNVKEIKKYYEKYDFKQIIKLISKNIVDLSTWYFDYIKDSLYCDKANNPFRVAIQATLYTLLDTYLRILAPIIPHTCEEAYDYFDKKDKLKSVHLEDFPTVKIDAKNKIDMQLWDQFFELKDLVYLEIEKARNEKIINTKGQATIIITGTSLCFTPDTLQKYLGVAKVEFVAKDNSKKTTVKVKNSKYTRCERCWNYYEANTIKNELCLRCIEVLKK